MFNININTTATVLVTIEFMISYSCPNIFQKFFELYVTTSCSLSESVKPFFCRCQFAAVLLLPFVIYEFISILRFTIHFFQQFIITKFHIYWHNQFSSQFWQNWFILTCCSFVLFISMMFICLIIRCFISKFDASEQ